MLQAVSENYQFNATAVHGCSKYKVRPASKMKELKQHSDRSDHIGRSSSVSETWTLRLDKSIIRCIRECLQGSCVNAADQLQSNQTCKDCLPIFLCPLFIFSLKILSFSGPRCLFLPSVNNVICHRQASVQEMTFRNLTVNWPRLAKLRHQPSLSLSRSHFLYIALLSNSLLLLLFNLKVSV